MLVSSSNLGDFFDQQTYQEKIKDKVISSMAAINALKAKLETDQANLQHLLADQQSQRALVQTQQTEANALLAQISQNAAAADQSVRDSNSQISTLKAQQAAALAAKYRNNGLVSSGTCGGGYPDKWCKASQDSLVDNWGLYNRECVSYTAFKVAISGRHMPYFGGRGNANQWPSSARADGIAVDSSPRAGDVAISMLGPYGHAMYVEHVSGNSIFVSQYNWAGQGEYSTMTIPSSGLYFIHF
jgi:surface antigen